MAKQTTSAKQSLKKKPPKQNKSVAAASASRRRKLTPKKQPGTRSSAPRAAQVTSGGHSPAQGKRTTKQDQLTALLLRDEGANIAQMTNATGWLPHTVRAALCGLKKKGFAIDSEKRSDVRTYRAAAPR